MEVFDPQRSVEPDNLFTPEVREWSLQKYKLVSTYCDIFTTGMKNKWDQLIYIDLFAGAGYAKIRETGKVQKNSALLAMSIPNTFTKYILCEQDSTRFDALKKRVERDFSHLNVELICGDSNDELNIKKVLSAIPSFKKGNTLLPFCFVDPYSINLKFSTIRALSNGLMDFLILQALHMDANRNLETYIKEENLTIANYLGIPEWRKAFDSDGLVDRRNFVKFLADQYQLQMVKIGYQTTKHMHQIRSNEKNLPLYYLSFYSKNQRGEDFFKKVQNRLSSQLSINF